jgi:WD40 repeat protein
MKVVSLVVLALAAAGAAPPGDRVLIPRAVLRGHAAWPDDVVFSPDSSLVAVCARRDPVREERPRSRWKRWGEIKVWDVQTGKAKATLTVDEGEPSALAFTPDGKKLFCVTRDVERRIRWDVATGKKEQVFRPKKEREGSMGRGQLLISRDGKRMAAAGHEVTIWDVTTGDETGRCDWEGWNRGVLSHDLRLAAVANHQDVDLYDVRTGKLARSLLDHPGSVRDASFSGDDRTFAASYAYRTDEGSGLAVCLWDAKRWVQLRTIEPKGLEDVSVELSPAGDLLVASGPTGERLASEVRLYETATGGELARLRPVPPGERVMRATFSPDGRFLALSCTDRSVRLYAVRLPRKSR